MDSLQIHYKSIRDSFMSTLSSPKKGAWLEVTTSSPEDLVALAGELDLDPSLLTDGIDLYEAPRIERDGDAVYVYVRYCNPHGHVTSTEPLLLIAAPNYLVTVSRKPVPELETILRSENTVTTQKLKLMLQILTSINKGYRSYINSVTKRIFSTRSRLAKTIINNDDVLTFIDIEEDLNEFLAALQPYSILLNALVSGRYFKLHEEDKDLIEDLELSTNELIDLSKSRLKTMQNIREAYTTIATNNLNKVFKRLTSITIFLMIPTLISGFYGMNVLLPLRENQHAFTIIVLITIIIVLSVIAIFKHRRWL